MKGKTKVKRYVGDFFGMGLCTVAAIFLLLAGVDPDGIRDGRKRSRIF